MVIIQRDRLIVCVQVMLLISSEVLMVVLQILCAWILMLLLNCALLLNDPVLFKYTRHYLIVFLLRTEPVTSRY